MRRLALLAGLAGALVLPASAAATNTITVTKVFYSGYVPYVDVSMTADPPCAVDTCRWYAAIRIAASAEGCAASSETPFTSGLERGGGGQRAYRTRYPTSTGARTEFACLVLYDTDSEKASVASSVAYEVPPQGGTYTPPGSTSQSGAAPASGGTSSGSPKSGSTKSGAPSKQSKAPRAFSRFAAGKKFNRSLTRKYGRRWTRARSRSVSCTARTIRTFRCVARFGRRTVRANVTRSRVRFI